MPTDENDAIAAPTMPAVPAEVALLRELVPAGVCVSTLDPRTVEAAALHPDEIPLVPRGDQSRHQQFVAGRLCARVALRGLGEDTGPLLVRPDGSPEWPEHVRGSISHKSRLCLAAVGSRRLVVGLGVDLEPAKPLPRAVLGAVLTEGERRRTGEANDSQELVRSRLVFSAKESYYKWYRSAGGRAAIGFHDVEVDVSGNRVTYRPRDPARLPTPSGRCVWGSRWLLTVAW